MSETTQTHYDILGLAPTAPGEVIKAAYKARVRQLHPDRGGDPAEMAAINEAYAVLSDPGKRAVYDRDLRQSSSAEERFGPADPFDGPVADEGLWADAGWEDEPAPGAPDNKGAEGAEGGGLAGLLSFIGLAGLWILTLITAGTVIVAGVIDDSSWQEIGFNVVLVAALAGVTLAAFLKREGQQRRAFPSKFYLAWVAILLTFGASELSGDPLTGAAVLLWAALLVLGAETGRRRASHHE